MRFLSRALSRSASSIDDEYPWIHSLSKERIIFQKVIYLFISFFSFLETRHFRTPFSLSHLLFLLLHFSFLRLLFSLSLSRCPTIFSLSLFNRGVCGGRVLKKWGDDSTHQKVELLFFCSLILLNRGNFFMPPYDLFLFFPSLNIVTWNLVVETRETEFKTDVARKKLYVFFIEIVAHWTSDVETVDGFAREIKERYFSPSSIKSW